MNYIRKLKSYHIKKDAEHQVWRLFISGSKAQTKAETLAYPIYTFFLIQFKSSKASLSLFTNVFSPSLSHFLGS